MHSFKIIIISQVSSLLGFQTPRAKQVVREGIDHHRNKFYVCLDAISKELLVPFVGESNKNDRDSTAEFYQEWLRYVEVRSYLFYYHITYYLLSFYLLTQGVRKNNSNTIMAARVQFAPLFYSFQHPKYQHLYLCNIWQRVQMLKSCKIIYALERALVSLEWIMLVRKEIFFTRSLTNA